MQITNNGITDLIGRVFDQPYIMQLKAVGTKAPVDANYSDVTLERSDWTVAIDNKGFQAVSRWVLFEFSDYRGNITGYVLRNAEGSIIYEKDFAEANYIGNVGDFVKVRSKIRLNLTG